MGCKVRRKQARSDSHTGRHAPHIADAHVYNRPVDRQDQPTLPKPKDRRRKLKGGQ